jgi:hypothetical protein
VARPRTPIGTFGDIDFTTLASDRVRARTRERDFDDQVQRVEATAGVRCLSLCDQLTLHGRGTPPIDD